MIDNLSKADIQSNMLVVHFSTTLRGGAGTAAIRAHEAVASVGVESSLVSIYGTNHQIRGSLDSRLATARRRMSTLGNKIASVDASQLVTPFGVNNSRALRLIDNLPDRAIIHLHNLQNLLQPREVIRVSQEKRVVLTLHDERFYSGACHYTNNCEKFRSSCFKCPQVKRAAHARVLRNQSEVSRRGQLPDSLVIIAPSRWIAERARESNVLQDANIFYVPNPIDTFSFSPLRRDQARARWGLTDHFVIATTGAKGGQDERQVLDGLAAMNADTPLLNLRLGGKMGGGSLQEIHLPYSESQRDVADFFAASDVFLNISHLDNFPNVNLEALASGVPVVTLGSGGLSEAITDTGGGLVAADLKEAISLLQALIENESDRRRLGKAARVGAVARYSYEIVGAQLGDIYRLLMDFEEGSK